MHYARELADTPIKVNGAAPGFVATDFNNFRGTRTLEEGAAVAIRLATLGPDGPTGAVFEDDTRLAWRLWGMFCEGLSLAVTGAGILWPGDRDEASAERLGPSATASGLPALWARACLAPMRCAARRWRWPGAGRLPARRGRGG